MDIFDSLPYPIHIGNGLLAELPFDTSGYSKIAIVSDTQIARFYLKTLKRGLKGNPIEILLPPGEVHKTLEDIALIWENLSAHNFDRHSLVINLGGGIVTDMGAFAAGCYMRGIDFIHLPTSLLCQVDACLGGKTGFDFASVKNLIGSFAQPRAIIIDVETLTTLPLRDLAAGMAEIIKHGLVRDPSLLEKLNQMHVLQDFMHLAPNLVAASLRAKAEIVIADPFEKGLRKILNFGHSVGHALEALMLNSKNPLLHGEAIALGMLVELRIGELLGLSQEKLRLQLRDLLIKMQLPTQLNYRLDHSRLHQLLQHDKKNKTGQYLLALPTEPGKCSFDIAVSRDKIDQSLGVINVK